MFALAFLLGCAAIGDDSAHAARAASAERTYETHLSGFNGGMGGVEAVCAWSVRWYEAERDAKKAQALERHRVRLQGLEKVVQGKVERGEIRAAEVEILRNYVAEAKVWR